VLVLSRKQDEDIVIKTPEGRTIVIKVVRIAPDKVRLGITAADGVVISRKEILNQQEAFSSGLERPPTSGPISSAG
jgi:carbon storage regulator CsrA